MKNILLLGSGGLRVGQAGEFDYSGSQAIKAFKEEGYRVILLNPNIATVQTDKSMADQIYFLPLDQEYVIKIIIKEQINFIALGFGGQTALNLGLALAHTGILTLYQIKVLGSSIATITATEDRDLFKTTLEQNQIKTPNSRIANNIETAIEIAAELGYPLMLRASFSLGGLGSGQIIDECELKTKVARALSSSSQILLEEYLSGWKEFEYEIIRDNRGNSLTICSMENLDPMGIHTGESIVIAPIQTLNDKEHQLLRNIALRCAHLFDILGECNIQFAVNPKNGDYRVIEINPRLSRSSALASKATGYPLAFIAAKLCLGLTLNQLSNSLNFNTTAFFEPALDYVVIKIPRWDTQKLTLAHRDIGTEMKSVGEVMAIGRSFAEALQKAVQMLNIGAADLHDYLWPMDDLEQELEFATDRRIFALYQWFLQESSLSNAQALTQIDYWFLTQIQQIAQVALATRSATTITPEALLRAKKFGFSDQTIALLTKQTEDEIRELRIIHNIIPAVKQIDGLAGEHHSESNYLYLSYHAQYHDVSPLNQTLVVIGSGPYAIGSSVEFDWCTVNLMRNLRQHQQQVILINSNPETVSTDYTESDRLYFEALTLERINDILTFENSKGIAVSVGGQIANNLALALYRQGYSILGTSPLNIDQAENRAKFSTMLQTLGIAQPRWINAKNIDTIKEFIAQVGLPILIRPSYVLSGAAMKVVAEQTELDQFLNNAILISPAHPIVVSQFIANAKELEIDGVAAQGKIIIDAISEHIENAGVHSGDANIVFPPEKLYLKTVLKVRDISRKIVRELNISGPFNMQFIAQHNDIQVIECNVRCSRSFPFISKLSGHDLIALISKIYLNIPIGQTYNTLDTNIVGIKSPVFSYNRFKGSDPIANVEMAATGEVVGIAHDILETFYLSWLAVGQKITQKIILLTVDDKYKQRLIAPIKKLSANGWIFIATQGTYQILLQHGIMAQSVFKISQQLEPNVQDLIIKQQVGLIINLPDNNFKTNFTSDGFKIRRLATDFHIPLVTNYQVAEILLESLEKYYHHEAKIYSYNELLLESSVANASS